MIITVGPGDGTLSLHTGRAGAVSKAGHDLTLQISQWTATATMSESGELRHLRVVALVGSLQVIRGEGGLKPLSDADRATILSNAQSTMKAAKHPEVVFETEGVVQDPATARLSGHITIAGVSRPLAVDVAHERAGDHIRARATAAITQSEFGIRPYSAMLGALRVRDMVEIRADLTVPTG